MQESEPGTESALLERNFETPHAPCDEPSPSVREASAPSLAGELAFLSPEAQLQRTAELLGEGAMVVAVPMPAASLRGHLGEHLDELVERALGIRGAPSRYLPAWSSIPEDADVGLEDQLFRARTTGASGIAIVLGSLSRIAAPALTPADSATLRSLANAAAEGGFVVLVEDGDEATGAYGEPVELGVMLGVAKASANADAEADASASFVNVPVHVPEAVPELVETHVDAPVAPVETARVEKVVARTEREAARRRQTAGVPVAGPSDFWRSWAIALGAARGPQPLASFERLFVESYMPLANAIAGGLDDTRAIRAHDEFKAGFERTYTDAFATFGATGRRPRLVMDAYDVAVKQARLHNARTTHVLVVDAMRHDLGCLVRDELATRAAGTASLTSDSLLWSSLPTTTYRQLETLARGMEALKAPAAEETTESLRGRGAETVRRLRVGSRELYKLDVVPSMLGALPDPSASPSPAHVVAALADIATSVTDALVRHIEALPPRTLLLVLGDHGFTIDRRGRITHGGASPEEVLVPCLAYLVGDLH